MADTTISGTPLAGKVAVVTGAASGMGAVMARALAAAGARVAGVDRDVTGLRRQAATVSSSSGGGTLRPVSADVAAPADCERAIAEILAAFGGIDILVNCAGVAMGPATPPGWSGPLRFWETAPEGWTRILAINAGGAFLMARFAVPHLVARGWGRVVNVTTSFDTMQRAGLSAYGASKAALEASSAIWAAELVGTGVTVNSLVPGGPTDTPFLPPDMPRAGLLKPEIMGPPIRWLASPESDGITGCRFIARDWDASLKPAEAAARCRAPAAWPDYAARARAERPG